MTKQWDAFVSHASEDKDAIARPLVECLTSLGAKIWFDDAELALGDSLLRTIDNGLINSSFGIVIISPAFLNKDWPDYELRGLTSREMGRDKIILPLWHGVNRSDILRFSPTLADKFAIRTESVDVIDIALKVLRIIRPDLTEAVMRKVARRISRSNARPSIKKLSEIRQSGPRHKELPKDLLSRIRLIRAALSSVHPLSFQDWVDGFRADSHPSEEVQVWERIAANFLETTDLPGITPQDKKAIFALLLTASTGPKEQISNCIREIREEIRVDVISLISLDVPKNVIKDTIPHDQNAFDVLPIPKEQMEDFTNDVRSISVDLVSDLAGRLKNNA